MKNANTVSNPEDSQSEVTTEWDSLKDADSLYKTENSKDAANEGAEAIDEYEVTNEAIYNQLLTDMTNDVIKAEVNGVPAEVLKSLTDSQDILVDAYAMTTIATENGEPEMSLSDALKQRKAVYAQKIELYARKGDERTDENIQLHKYTAELIEQVETVKKNIEQEHSSTYQKLIRTAFR